MGVDSCGYVWKDVEGGQFEDGQTEIQIVFWSGLPEQYPSNCVSDSTDYNV